MPTKPLKGKAQGDAISAASAKRPKPHESKLPKPHQAPRKEKKK